MNFHSLTLIIPDKADPERDRVAKVWEENDGVVLRLGRFWEPPELDANTVRLYGNDTFCLVLEQKLGLTLLSPPDDMLVSIDRQWTKRTVRIRTLSEMQQGRFPQFVKPLVPKIFRAAIYHSVDELQEECAGLDGATPILVSEIIEMQSEARSFILDGNVETSSIYQGAASLPEARNFTVAFVAENQGLLPRTCVIDVGCVGGSEWVVVEANGTWGAGLNGCDAGLAARCIAHATELPR